jgi:hypothetical protein
VKLRGEVRKGQLVIEPAGLAIACRHFGEGKRVSIEVEPEKNLRTLSQNAYYHAVVVPVIAHILTERLRKEDPDCADISHDEAHDALKRHILGKVIAGGIEVVRSTTRLSTIGFSDFVERARQIAAEEGYYIPEPGSRDEVSA